VKITESDFSHYALFFISVFSPGPHILRSTCIWNAPNPHSFLVVTDQVWHTQKQKWMLQFYKFYIFIFVRNKQEDNIFLMKLFNELYVLIHSSWISFRFAENLRDFHLYVSQVLSSQRHMLNFMIWHW